MATTPITVRSEADIWPAYRGTPVGDLLRYHNLGAAPGPGERGSGKPALLVSLCMDQQDSLRLPTGFAITLRTGAGSLKRVPFKVSWAVGIAGVAAIAVVGHDACAMVGLREHRAAFIARLITAGGWERPAAEQHFDHWSDLFEVDDPAAFAVAEAARLRRRYPRLLVAPLLYATGSGLLQQLAD